jgi:hypothetical protein
VNEPLSEALYRIASDVPELGDIDRALRDVRIRRRRAALLGVAATCLVLLLFQGLPGGRTLLEPAGPTPAPGCPDPAALGAGDDTGPQSGNPVMDDAAGVVVVQDQVRNQTWVFDVCRAAWHQRSPDGPAGPTDLVHDSRAGLTLAIPRDLRDPVWTYSAQRDEWVKLPPPSLVGDRGSTRAALESDGRPATAYDPHRGVVLAWAWKDASVWSFDLATNTWTRVAGSPGGAAPPAGEGLGAIQYVTFDPGADRLVVTLGSDEGRQTWQFDPESATWAQGASPPQVGTWHQGRVAAYDPALGRSLLFSMGTLAGYDAGNDRWQPLTSNATWSAWLVPDSVNDRLLALRYLEYVSGTTVVKEVASTWAYDPETGAWNQLRGP